MYICSDMFNKLIKINAIKIWTQKGALLLKKIFLLCSGKNNLEFKFLIKGLVLSTLYSEKKFE